MLHNASWKTILAHLTSNFIICLQGSILNKKMLDLKIFLFPKTNLALSLKILVLTFYYRQLFEHLLILTKFNGRFKIS